MKHDTLIAKFMDFPVFINSLGEVVWFDHDGERRVMYSDSWDWLIPVCHKWDQLYLTDPLFKSRNTDNYEYYLILCDRLDNEVTKRYEIKDAYNQIVANITWYNTKKNENQTIENDQTSV